MPRRSLSSGVCVLGLLSLLLAAGCGRAEERVPTAKQGVGRLAYKQLVVVSRAASLAPQIEEADEEDADDEDTDDSALAAQPAGIPPGSWAAAFPAPDVPPMPTAREPPPEDPPAHEVAAAPPAPPPQPQPAPAPAPVAVEPPAEEALPEPQVVIYVPGSNEEEAPAAAPEEPPSVDVSIVVVNPLLPGRPHSAARPSTRHRRSVQTRPHRPSRPQVAAKPPPPTPIGAIRPPMRVR